MDNLVGDFRIMIKYIKAFKYTLIGIASALLGWFVLMHGFYFIGATLILTSFMLFIFDAMSDEKT